MGSPRGLLEAARGKSSGCWNSASLGMGQWNTNLSVHHSSLNFRSQLSHLQCIREWKNKWKWDGKLHVHACRAWEPQAVGRAELLTRFRLIYYKLGNVKTYTIPMGQITFSMSEFTDDSFCHYLKVFPVCSARVVSSSKKLFFYSCGWHFGIPQSTDFITSVSQVILIQMIHNHLPFYRSLNLETNSQ